MAIYQSEITRFLAQLKQQNPKLEAEQARGRALLWDKEPISLERQAQLDSAKLAQQAYPYQTK
jgi:hypothetical protein